jgi:hypothetical protein
MRRLFLLFYVYPQNILSNTNRQISSLSKAQIWLLRHPFESATFAHRRTTRAVQADSAGGPASCDSYFWQFTIDPARGSAPSSVTHSERQRCGSEIVRHVLAWGISSNIALLTPLALCQGISGSTTAVESRGPSGRRDDNWEWYCQSLCNLSRFRNRIFLKLFSPERREVVHIQLRQISRLRVLRETCERKQNDGNHWSKGVP